MADDPRLVETILDVLGPFTLIDGGFTADRKYLVYGPDRRYLLRVSDTRLAGQRRIEFDAVHALSEKGIACPEAVRFGEVEGVCYNLYTYIEGDSALDVVPHLTVEEQTAMGVAAGRELVKIHTALGPGAPYDERTMREGKFRRYVAEFRESGFAYVGQETAEDFVERYIHLLEGRPCGFRHGDFHLGNMVVRDGRFAGIIDFDRCDWGDPVDDFYKTSYFGAPISAAYACGLMRGYFDGPPPTDFWPLYNVYVAATMPADLVWSAKFSSKEYHLAVARVERIARTHDFAGGGPPAWWS